MKKEVIAHGDPKSPISEIFRTLRTNIQFITTDKKIQTLLVTSTLPGEGKSWIASNLAVTFAQTGKNVVLVDADMRKGRQYGIFNTSPTPGLSNYLSQVGLTKKEKAGEEIVECIRKTEVPNLFLMPAGSIPPNPSELLVSPKMIKLLEKLKQAFDIVIIDGTPCELVTDAVILSRIVDSTLIVTAHKVTKKDALERVIKNIQNVGGKITGVVVNKMPISGKKYEKQYYYYGEGSKFEEKKNEIETVKKQPTPKITIKEQKASTTKKAKQPTQDNKKASSKDIEEKKSTSNSKKETKKEEPNITKQQEEKIQKERTDNILKQMNEYLEKENAKKQKGEEND